MRIHSALLFLTISHLFTLTLAYFLSISLLILSDRDNLYVPHAQTPSQLVSPIGSERFSILQILPRVFPLILFLNKDILIWYYSTNLESSS